MAEYQIELRPTVIHCQTEKTDAQLLRLEQLLDAHAKILVEECEAQERALGQTAEYLASFWRLKHATAH